MSAAATAAGYLYAHNRLPVAELNRQAGAERRHCAAASQPSSRAELRTASRHAEPHPAKDARAPRIEYRKRRIYPVPAAA
jgi:hypothetical protein